MTHFFHYTSYSKYQSIISGTDYGRCAIVPTRRLVNLNTQIACKLSEKTNEPAIFGLLTPMPTGWCQSQYHADEPLLETVLDDINAESENRICLLHVTVAPEDDVWVLNHGSHLRQEYNGKSDTKRSILKKVKLDYWKSRIALPDYQASPLQYTLPEVVCFSEIPVARVALVQTFDKAALINTVRQRSGLEPHPKRTRAMNEAADAILDKLLGIQRLPAKAPRKFEIIRGGLSQVRL